MTGLVHLHEGEVARGLDLAVLLLGASKLQVLDRGLVEVLLAGPLKSLSPGLVTEPVADVVGITGIDENGDLLEEVGDEAMEWLHPVALEQKVAVDVKVAAFVARDLNSKSIHDILLVEIVADPAKSAIAEVAAILTLATDVINVLAGPLVGANERIVAVNRSRNATPDTTRVVAVLDEGLAAGKSIVHAAALRLVKNGGVTTLAASHRAVVLVLSKTVGQTIPDKNRLEVDVAVLVGQDLRGKDGNVVTSIGLASNVEVLLGVLGELVEEEGQESVDILASSNGVAYGVARVRVTDVDGLVKEDDAGIVVPAELVVHNLELLVDR